MTTMTTAEILDQARAQAAAKLVARPQLTAAEVTAVTVDEMVGQPFTARYGDLAGQQAVKVRSMRLIVAVAHAKAPEGQIVWRGTSERNLVTISVSEYERRRAVAATVVGEIPSPLFGEFDELSDETIAWLPSVYAALRAAGTLA